MPEVTRAPPIARGLLFEPRESAGRLELWAPHHPRYGAVCADWCDAAAARRVAGGRRQLLARAVGLHRRAGLRILDATAGFGRDGYTLAALGARVDMAERHPLLLRLLEDAQRRALADPRTADAARRIRLIAADASELLRRPPAQETPYDVIYLDPMYPEEGGAMPRKEMQFLRELTGGDPDADALLEPARRAARQRVVVKRPRTAPCLAGAEPAYRLRGTQARFDVYLPGT